MIPSVCCLMLHCGRRWVGSRGPGTCGSRAGSAAVPRGARGDANRTMPNQRVTQCTLLTVELSSTTPGTNSLSLRLYHIPRPYCVQLTCVLTPTRGPVTPRPQFLAGVPRILLVTVPTTTSRRAPPPLPPPPSPQPPPRAGAVARTSAVTSRLPRLRTVALHSSSSPRLLRLELGLGLRLRLGGG